MSKISKDMLMQSTAATALTSHLNSIHPVSTAADALAPALKSSAHARKALSDMDEPQDSAANADAESLVESVLTEGPLASEGVLLAQAAQQSDDKAVAALQKNDDGDNKGWLLGGLGLLALGAAGGGGGGADTQAVVPVNPVTPVTPVDPVTPVTPVDPVTPVTPVDPVKPQIVDITGSGSGANTKLIADVSSNKSISLSFSGVGVAGSSIRLYVTGADNTATLLGEALVDGSGNWNLALTSTLRDIQLGEYSITGTLDGKTVEGLDTWLVQYADAGGSVMDTHTYAGHALLIGKDGADTLIGTEKSDILIGLGGVDNYFGGGGHDTIYLGAAFTDANQESAADRVHLEGVLSSLSSDDLYGFTGKDFLSLADSLTSHVGTGAAAVDVIANAGAMHQLNTAAHDVFVFGYTSMTVDPAAGTADGTSFLADKTVDVQSGGQGYLVAYTATDAYLYQFADTHDAGTLQADEMYLVATLYGVTRMDTNDFVIV